MLTAAVLSGDAEVSGILRASLEQSGLVGRVHQLPASGSPEMRPGEAPPDIMLLDLGRDFESALASAAAWRRRYPTVCIIACAPFKQPDPSLLLQAMRSGVQEFLSAPVEISALREALTRFAQERQTTTLRQQDKLIVVMGTKGGVGTTTVAANVGAQLAKVTGKRVEMFDLARPLGNLCLLMDLHPKFTIRDAVDNLEHLDSHFLTGLIAQHTSGVGVLGGTSRPEQWEGVSTEAVERVVNVAQGGCDFLVVDGGVTNLLEGGTSFRTARAIIITTVMSVPALWGLERRLKSLIEQGADPTRIRIIVNRWRKDDDEALQNIEKRIKHHIFARLPNDYRQVSEAESVGKLLSRNHSDPLVTKFRNMACQLAGIDPEGVGDKRGTGGFFAFPSKK
jgi:pilus assembly protein CpaE